MNSKAYPSLKQAEEIWLEGIRYRQENPEVKPLSQYIEEEYKFHTRGVAAAAKKIASRTVSLNPEKAYILGLLHDYGKKKDEKSQNIFHGRVGYDEMINKGYSDVARICLTHTFPTKDFDDKDFWYPQEWKDWLRKELKSIQYDDYDRLIQLCDKFFEGMTMISIERRMRKIVERYNLNEETYQTLVSEGIILKKYFDNLCGVDVYEVLGIEA
ncbi:MAG: HD domain-containing protein [Alphaproteobacteria bacterium]